MKNVQEIEPDELVPIYHNLCAQIVLDKDNTLYR